MREATLATGALPALLTIITACLAAATSARHQSYIICKEPDSYICQACPLLPEFNELVYNWVSREAGSCILVEELPNIISPPFYSFKTLGGGEIEMDCNEVVIVSEAKARGILRVRRQIGAQPRGRYRGQTQSQYLAIDHGGKEEGKAEAHSAADSSRASVSGNSGMGQAQSQSIYDPSCDDCYGRTTPDAGNLKKKPFDVSDRHDGYGSSGWTGPINGTPIKNTFGSNQNIGPGLGGSGQSQPGPQSYEQHYRGPGEGTLAPGSAIERGTGVPNGNSGFDPNGNRNMQGTGPGKDLGTFQTDPLLTKGGSRLGPSISGYGPTQQSNGGYDPNTRDRQGSSLGPEHGDMHYNTFGPGRINAPGSDSFPPGSLMNSPVGTGAPGQERVISTDGRPNQNNYGIGSSPGLYSPGQNSVLIPGNGPALTGPRYVSPGSLGPTIPNGIYNVNQARDPNGLGGANQVGEPGRGYSPDNKNSGIRGSEQPSGNWPVGSYIPGTSPYFCCVVGPDGNIIPAGGLPYNRGLNINSQYPNGNKYALSGQGFDPRNTGQNIGIGSTPPLQTSYGVGDPRYGGNSGQDPRSSIYGPISGGEKSFTPDQKVPGNSDNSINQNIPNNYMQRPGASDVSGGYKPAYAPDQSGVYKQGITPGVSGNFSPGQGSLGSFGPGHVDGSSNLGSYIPGHGGNLRDNTYGPGQVYGTRFRAGYGPEDTDGQGSTGSERDRNNGIRFTNDYHRPDHTTIPSGGGESGTYRPGQNAGTFGPPSTGNFAPGNLNSGYRPGLSSDKYGPGSTSGIYLPGQNIGGHGPSHATGSYGPGDASGSYGPGDASGSYGPGDASGSYGPDIVSGSYGPGQSSGNSGPGQATGSYMPSQATGTYGPGQATGTYGPGQESGSYGPGQASGSYGPNQVSGGYGPGQASGGYRPDQVNGGYGPGQASGGYRPGQVSGGYVPDQASGGYRPGQASGGYGPGQASGGYGPGQASGGYGPGQASGGYGPGQTSGGYGTSQGSGGYGPGQASGGYGPGQASGGYGPSQGSGGYGPGQASGGYGPGQASGGYGPGQASSGYRPGQASGGYDQSLGPGPNNVSGVGDFFTQRGVNPLSQGAYGPNSPGENYGSVGRPGDRGRFNINEPIYGSDKYSGGAIGNGYDPRLYGHTSNYNGVPQNFTDPNTLAEGDDSAAEASVSQAANGTTASASSRGGNDKGRAQTNVHGTYTGGGSFSAQALITGENKEAESEVTGGKKGASSAAQGSGRNNKSQANVQLGSETGSVQTQSLTNGAYHSSNSQVQGSVKGGMADAQARGPGSTSSQAQIGFTPYKDGDKSHDLQKVPFVGGGLASAQSSARIGQSQSQLHGTFKYGITYNGAAQAGSSIDKDAVFPNRLSFDKIDVFDEKEKNINVDTETSPVLDISSTTSTTPILEPEPTEESLDKSEDEVSTESDLNALNTKDESEKEDETLKNSESRYSSHTHLDHHKTNDEPVSSPVSSSATRSFQSSYGNNGAEYEYTTDKEDVQPDEYDTDGQEEEQGEYVIYDDIPRDTLTHQSLQSPRNSLDVKQSSGGNTQHIVLGSFKNHDAEITQKNSESPDESKTYQPGERVPGTGGYTIPIGFTGSVKSVASKEKTYVVGSKESPSQAQTVTLTPGSGRVKYSYLQPSYGRVEAGKLRSLATRPRDNRYVSVSKSVARDLDAEDNVRKQYSHSYYTKSSSCGFFTFTCTMVSGADGKKKVCSPKIPRNPDGTPIRC